MTTSPPPRSPDREQDLSSEDSEASNGPLIPPLTAEYLLDEDTQATRRNLDPVRDRRDPKQVHAETAGSLAWVLVASFAVLLAAVVGCGTAIAYHAPGEAGSVIGLFAAVLTTLGTALGGVVGFYFRQRDDDTGPKHTNPPSGESPPPGAA